MVQLRRDTINKPISFLCHIFIVLILLGSPIHSLADDSSILDFIPPILAGSKGDTPPPPVPPPSIERFVTKSHIDLSKIWRVSRFRSGIGHDNSDDSESCRSMKHYFMPFVDIEWSDVQISSPIKGKITHIDAGSTSDSGKQVHIQATDYPEYTFVLYHVNVNPSLPVGTSLAAGQLIGTHIGAITMNDILVNHFPSPPDSWQLISIFDLMSNSLFLEYQKLGVESREAFIIEKEERDNDPLTCEGEFGEFVDQGNIENWVELNICQYMNRSCD
jgi:hypothetical protein